MPRTAASPNSAAADRAVERLARLFAIGRAAGTNRHGLATGENEAHDLVAEWMTAAGLVVTRDAAGNLFGTAPGSEPGTAPVWTGSHLDTPPDGGAYDGALGVVAALEVAAAVAAAGGARRPVTAVAFRMEEGWRFGRGVFGSRAVVGSLDADEGGLRDAAGVTLAEAFAASGLGRLPGPEPLHPHPACFVEAHIEQGPSLAATDAALGVVTSIAGMAGIDVAFAGERGHAGTVPMEMRRDALAAAAAFVGRAHAAARGIRGAVATIGRLTVSPGATNTIPGRAELFADVRAPDAAGLDALVAAVHGAAEAAAAGSGCEAQVTPRWRYEPVAMDAAVSEAVRRGIVAAGHEPVELASGAGHDAAILAEAGVPAAMLFVRSDAGGVSHAPEEHTGADAVAASLAALEATVRELAA